jgi:hypothetical protein
MEIKGSDKPFALVGQGTASLYMYFASTASIVILVSLMPPNRPHRWLGGRSDV